MPSMFDRAARRVLAPGFGVATAALIGLSGCAEDVRGATTFDTLDPTTTGDPGTTDTGSSSGTTDATATGTETSAGTSSSGVDDSSSSNDTNQGALCGDGIISGNEECDCGGIACTADGLDNKQCPDVEDLMLPGPITGGTLGCNPGSCRFDTSMCAYCGDGMLIGDLEECEPELPIDTSCMELGKGTAGALVCNADCTLDTSACTDCGYQFYFDAADCPEGFTTG